MNPDNSTFERTPTAAVYIHILTSSYSLITYFPNMSEANSNFVRKMQNKQKQRYHGGNNYMHTSLHIDTMKISIYTHNCMHILLAKKKIREAE